MGKGSKITIELSEDGGQPVFINLASSIIRDIERGRLKPGDALPGTRSLAKSLKLNRNTVDAAYQELTLQGWLVAKPSRGTFVADDLSESKPSYGKRHIRAPADSGASEATTRPLLHLSDGLPDPRIMPGVELARAFRRALISPSFLSGSGYGDPRGSIALRTSLADYLMQERGLTAAPENVLVTRGSQMALFLAAGAVLEPGQAIAVEEPGYPLAWSAFRAAGARVIGVPVGAQGLDVEHLARLAEREPALKAVYLTPHHQYPTTVTLGAGRRLRLLQIARQHGLAILEDDYDHECRFEGRPVLPLAARADPELSVVYVGSLSKLLAPAVRIGYAVAKPALLERMADHREAIDRQGDLPLEQALANLIDDGELRRHARKARRIYKARRDFLAVELDQQLGEAVSFDIPAGGLAIWLRLGDDLSAETWAGKAAQAGLAVAPGTRFVLDTAIAPEAFRVGYASLDDTDLRRAVTLLRQTRP
ncbi:GntR family transcriptional regulator [Erythrobacter sp. QSSC1-22B]|uniref:MocR-like pyridoxine biosynthesis transcription factor PdxR n=1 Tax=Erythrobacter sp. QSSC1-22B TaxID=1860125 RepID=UPI00080481BB|nr:PLP-dependent aminotransferase family protein [Erythrobacter sp. QSSC1-22B]OBX20067.1 GntR family transcriptional regulator [Erythrobacter sp. QSSC1-22B]